MVRQRNNLHRVRWNSNSYGPRGSWGSRFGSPRWQKFGGTIILLMAMAKLFDPGRNSNQTPQSWSAPSQAEFSVESLASSVETEVRKATRHARQHLPEFIEKLCHPSNSERKFAVRARFYEAGEVVHLWVDNIAFDGTHFTGNVSSELPIGAGLDEGDGVCVGVGKIVDWYYEDAGTPVGAFTFEVARDHLTFLQKQFEYLGEES